MTCDDLIPTDGSPDHRRIHRFATARLVVARRQGRLRHVLLCTRLIRESLRALRFAARRVRKWVFDDSLHQAHPHSSHPLFSGEAKHSGETSPPTAQPNSDHRHTLREERWRR